MTSTLRTRIACLFAGLAALVAPGRAVADPPPKGDAAQAQALFNAAQKALDRGDYAEACPKFEQSFLLDKSVSTKLNIAKCHERDGKLAVAWAEYQEALGLNQYTVLPERQKKLDAFARKAIGALEPRVPKLRVVVTNATEGMTVTRDGKPTVAGEALPVDPGAHEVEASAPGRKAEKRHFEIAEGQTLTVELVLADDRAPVSIPSVVAPAVTAPVVAAPAPKQEADVSGGRARTWAWIVGGIGLAMAGASVPFRVDQSSIEHDIAAACGAGNQHCPATFDAAAANARKNRDAALFVGLAAAGGAAIVVSIVGLATAPRAKKRPERAATPSPWVTANGGGMELSGRF